MDWETTVFYSMLKGFSEYYFNLNEKKINEIASRLKATKILLFNL